MGKTKDYSALDTAIKKKQPAPDDPGRSKALTLKLSASEYERLRVHAFNKRTTHQDVIHQALMDYLDKQ